MPSLAQPSGDTRGSIAADEPPPASYPLGAARAQINDTFIIAATGDALVIVDQHAAHERLVYERLKRSFANGGIARQILLIPEVVELDAEAVASLSAASSELERLGLVIEPFGANAVLVREVPSLLGTSGVKGLLADLAAELAESEDEGGRAPPCRAPRSCAFDHGLPWQREGGAAASARGDERAPSRHGGDPVHRAMQSRPSDLYRAQARRYREIVFTALIAQAPRT